MIRVGFLTYLNVAPFYWQHEKWKTNLIPCVPRKMGQLAAQGEIDAGPLAVADWFAVEADFEPLGPYGVATWEQAQSSLLFSSVPIERLNDTVVGVTEETSSSACLMRLLLEDRYRIQPREYRRGAQDTAWLVIGDAALHEKKRARLPYQYDLGAEWWDWKRLPFVFAHWVVRRSVPAAEKAYLREVLAVSLEGALDHLAEVAMRYTERVPLSVEEIVAYFRNFTYRIGKQEVAGLDEFRRMWLSRPGTGRGGVPSEQPLSAG